MMKNSIPVFAVALIASLLTTSAAIAQDVDVHREVRVITVHADGENEPLIEMLRGDDAENHMVEYLDGGAEMRVIRVNSDAIGSHAEIIREEVIRGMGSWYRQDDEEMDEDRPYMGIVVERVPESFAYQLGIEPGVGLIIEDVRRGTPADEAGLRDFDIITMYDDQILTSSGQLDVLKRRTGVGNTVDLTVLRAGEELVIELTMGER